MDKRMMKFIKKIFCFVLLSVIILGVSGGSNYTNGLIRYLKEKSKLHQVMFIIDDQFLANAESNATAQLIRDVSKHFPSLSISLHEAQTDLEKYFSLHLQIPRRTTLFVFILNASGKRYMNELIATFKILRYLSHGHSYPKCLINLTNQKKVYSYKAMLKSLWHDDFLDISVLENLIENRTWQTVDVTTIHRINLFTKKYTNQKVNPRRKWFPNKVLNLHGQRFNFLVPGFSDKIGRRIWIEIQRFIDYVMQSMHCNITILLFRRDTMEKSLSYNESAEIVIAFSEFKLLNATVNTIPMRILSFSTIKAVIPTVGNKNRSVEVSQEFIYMILATIGAFAVIKIVALLLKFSRSTWNTFNICQIIMGMSVDNKPRKLAERIVFGAFMLSCMVYSGYMFSVILDINFREVSQIQTLEELANSSLTSMFRTFINDSMLNSPLVQIQKLAAKSTTIPGHGMAFDCLRYLIKNRNVSCILFDAETSVKSFIIKDQELGFQILQESIVHFPKSWITRKGSPFVDRFNEIILRAFDHGLLQKLLFADYTSKVNKISSADIIEKEKLLLVLFHLLTIGYILAAIAFLAEIFNNFIYSKVKQFWLNRLNFF